MPVLPLLAPKESPDGILDPWQPALIPQRGVVVFLSRNKRRAERKDDQRLSSPAFASC